MSNLRDRFFDLVTIGFSEADWAGKDEEVIREKIAEFLEGVEHLTEEELFETRLAFEIYMRWI